MSATLQVTPIAWTHFDAAAAENLTADQQFAGWHTDADGGQALAEFSGRACYESWTKPSQATATNAGYLAHILEVGHLSVLEHGTVTFYMTGVSRSLTHELVRHRMLSYSQLSQRYVDETDADMITPRAIADDAVAEAVFIDAVKAAQAHYDALVRRLTKSIEAQHPSWSKTELRKAARQAARSVLPNATETRIVVTGNYRAWRHFIDMRATRHADVEIRAAAVEVLRHLQRIAPNVFGDYVISVLGDGTEAAASTNMEVA